MLISRRIRFLDTLGGALVGALGLHPFNVYKASDQGILPLIREGLRFKGPQIPLNWGLGVKLFYFFIIFRLIFLLFW